MAGGDIINTTNALTADTKNGSVVSWLTDNATWEIGKNSLPSTGIPYVLLNGAFVVNCGPKIHIFKYYIEQLLALRSRVKWDLSLLHVEDLMTSSGCFFSSKHGTNGPTMNVATRGISQTHPIPSIKLLL